MHFENYTQDVARGRHTFDIVDVDLSVANALRRIALTDLPVAGFRGEAVDGAAEPSIDILENNGPLHNEFMSHRIGMIPICFSEKEMDAFGNGGGDDPSTMTFELDVSNTGVDMRNVTTHDIVVRRDKEVVVADTARLFPAHHVTHAPILITRLRENERLHFIARAVKSSAREHAGFSAMAKCTYTFVSDPVAADAAVGILDKERAFRHNAHGDPTHIQFRMETVNAFSVRYVVRRAFDILVDKLAASRHAIDVGDATRVSHGPAKDNMAGYEFTFKKEDDTLGNIIQSLIHVEHIRRKPKGTAPAITFVGYFCPHPLDETVVVRIVMADDAPPVPFFQQQLERIQRVVEDLRAEWIEFAPKA